MLQWQLDAASCRVEDCIFVVGYQAEEIRRRYPGLLVVENIEWRKTGSAASMLQVPLTENEAFLVAYSDVLFRGDVSARLASTGADIAVAFDSRWVHGHVGRSTDVSHLREKVLVRHNVVLRLGADLPADWATGEFIGLVWFSARATACLQQLKAEFPKSLRQLSLAELVEYLRIMGMSIRGVDVAGEWAEFNEPRDIAIFVLGTKADTLSRLRGLVQHSIIQDQIAFSVASWRMHRDVLIERVKERFPNQSLMVRSSAQSEDNFNSSSAGRFDSIMDVDPAGGLKDAIHTVIASYGENAHDDDQVLIQPMLSCIDLSGVAFTRTLDHGAPWYVINYDTAGKTNAITSGSYVDHRTLLMHRGIDIDGDGFPEPRLRGLVKALKEVESLTGYDQLDVEFAIERTQGVQILQVRPLNVSYPLGLIEDEEYDRMLSEGEKLWDTLAPAPPQIPGDVPPLYGVMTDWNPAEIIGTAPGNLAASIYRFLLMDEIWAIQRFEYGYRDVRPAPLLVQFSGQPYIDVRASFASFLPAAIPDELAGRLLKFYLSWLRERPELHDKVEFDVVPTCLGPGFSRWEKRLSTEGGFTYDEIAQLKQALRSITARAFERPSEDFEKIELLASRYQAIMADERLQAIERARLLLDDCRRLGTLPFAHLARSSFVAVAMLREAVEEGIITQEGQDSFLSSIRTISHELTQHAREVAMGVFSWERFVERYGHLRPGTYDINSPRYDADPEQFLKPLISHVARDEPEREDIGPWMEQRNYFCHALEAQGLPHETEKIECFMRQAIQGREYAKFVFTRNVSAALEALADFGTSIHLTRDQLYDVDLNEFFLSRSGGVPNEEIALRIQRRSESGRQLRKLAVTCKLPPLLTEKSDLRVSVLGADQPNFIGTASVIAGCIDLDSQVTSGFSDVKGYIVMTRNADPGYDWLFASGIVGLVTLFGGANSHMA
ncbi:MAG: hypothetical protein VKL39_13655, partial [Leptolyngbyaceae bacterium]|nr:hypothetical protein [Leptolyngbyaceae bacterium]